MNEWPLTEISILFLPFRLGLDTTEEGSTFKVPYVNLPGMTKEMPARMDSHWDRSRNLSNAKSTLH